MFFLIGALFINYDDSNQPDTYKNFGLSALTQAIAQGEGPGGCPDATKTCSAEYRCSYSNSICCNGDIHCESGFNYVRCDFITTYCEAV